jgi:hypothetical protein
MKMEFDQSKQADGISEDGEHGHASNENKVN